LLPAKVPAEIKSTPDLPQPAVIDWIVEQLSGNVAPAPTP
jgi:hypothetical protein